MAKALSRWQVFPHGPLEQLEDNLWRVEQPLPRSPLHRVFSVARMNDGKLLFHSAIALEEPAMRSLEGAGSPAFLVVPNGFHRLDARIFKERYPALRVVAPRGSRVKVEEVVPVDLTCEQFPGDESVRMETLDGTGEQEAVLIVRSGERTTLVFNDAVFNMPHQPGLPGLALRALGSSGGPRVSRLARLLLVKDRGAFRSHLERLAGLPGLARVIVSHHEVVERDAAGILRRVASTLLSSWWRCAPQARGARSSRAPDARADRRRSCRRSCRSRSAPRPGGSADRWPCLPSSGPRGGCGGGPRQSRGARP